jgi:N6-adenosine-specific RNA methylase IME4
MSVSNSATDVPPKRKRTGYSVYKIHAENRTKKNTLEELYPELPEEKFDIVYADPPWDYGGKLQFDKSSKSAERIDLAKNIFISSAAFKYPTLKLSELVKLRVVGIAKEDCLLFLWATSPHLQQAITLGEAWGFEYRTVAFIWDKMIHNPGKYTLSNCELCLVFKRGKIPSPRGARNIQQLIRAPRKEHSEKPREVAHAIEKMFPSQNRIELFARKAVHGWSAWGLDLFNKTNEEFRSNPESPISGYHHTSQQQLF